MGVIRSLLKCPGCGTRVRRPIVPSLRASSPFLSYVLIVSNYHFTSNKHTDIHTSAQQNKSSCSSTQTAGADNQLGLCFEPSQPQRIISEEDFHKEI